MRAPSRWMTVIAGVLTLSSVACTRSSDSERNDPPEPKPSAVTTTTLSTALSTDVTQFAPTSADKVGLIIRFDRMRNTPLARATEELLRWLPDHRRVVGNTGNKVRNVFDLVLMTSSDPGLIVTTNMAARMAVTPVKMRTMLNNTLSPTKWTSVVGGALGTSKSAAVLGGDDRLYLIPMRNWIVLARPPAFGGLLAPRKGGLDRHPRRAGLVKWLKQVPRLTNVGGSTNRLIALATLNKLPQSISLPLFGSLQLPRRAAAALERYKYADVFSGVLYFDTVATAKSFASTVAGAQRILAVYNPKAGGPQLPALRALRSIVVRRVGKRMHWSMATKPHEAVELTKFASKLIGQWASGGVPPTHGKVTP